ncbi:MAG: flagellar filament capping protein FliD [Opitutae bacterium]|nr:flagellar filament capping protein FliD [Opitutae bacterium]
MSNGMQLSGLASGMDWQNVVDQLMELERIPIKKMQAQQVTNARDSAELSNLSSKLTTMDSYADSLANADLWDARSVALSDPNTSLLSASAATGTIVGDYVISDATKATGSVLYGKSDMKTNIVTGDTIEDLNTSTAITEGNFTINGTVLSIGTSGTFALTDTLTTAVANITANVTGVTAGVENGKFYLESSSEVILGHADDSSNFLSVMKLFSQSEKNYREVGGTQYYSKTETAGTTSTTNFYRAGDYVWDGTNYYQVLTDAPRGSDLSTAPNTYFGAGTTTSPVAQIDTITGLAADAREAQIDTVTITNGGGTDDFNVTVDGNALPAAIAWDTDLATTASNLAAAINANGALSAIVTADASAADGSLTLTAATAGTSFTASSTVTNNGGGAATTDATTNANVTGDTMTVTVDGTAVPVTVTTGTSAANIATDIASAINASGISGTVTAAVVGSNVTVTADTPGTAFTMTVGSTEGADGVVTTTISNSTTTNNDPGSPDTFRSLSEFSIGSVDSSKSIKEALGVSDGTYTFTINNQSFTVKNGADATASEIDIDNTTLQQLMDKVTASSAGVTMSYNPVDDRFILTNKETGNIKISASDTANTLLGTMELTTNSTFTKGNDATLTINGTIVTSNSNSVTGTSHGIDGLTVTILDDFATTDSDITITLATDTSGASSAIDSFISSYNDVQSYLRSVTQTTTTGDNVQTSIFSDNFEVTSLGSSLRAAVFGDQYSVNPFTMEGTGFERIQDIGLDFVSGSNDLQVANATTLANALSGNGSQVKEIFMSSIDPPGYYSSTTTYDKGELTEYDGAYWIALQGTTGNQPPSYDTTNAANIDANWSFYGYNDGVARRANDSSLSDYTGTPVINGVAYGAAHRVSEFIGNFTAGTTPDPDDTQSDGTIPIQIATLQDSNDQLDVDIANLETLLAQREQQMINSFVRMEEMQAGLQSQSQMLQSSIDSNFGSGSKKK